MMYVAVLAMSDNYYYCSQCALTLTKAMYIERLFDIGDKK